MQNLEADVAHMFDDCGVDDLLLAYFLNVVRDSHGRR